LKGRTKKMKQMKIPIALLISVIVILAAFSPALAATPQISMAPKVRTAESWLSGNWAGYAVTGDDGSVTSVSGSWTVSTVTGSKRETSYSAFWVGIDGFSSDSVEQIGTSSDMRNGKAVYYAWYEFYPLQPMQLISSTEFSVSPGDQISATVTYSENTFTLTITDLTNPDTYTTSKPVSELGYTPKLSSAEWIAEAPSNFRGILPLANFDNANFGYQYTDVPSTCYATINGVTEPIGHFDSSAIQQIWMGTTSTRGRTTTTTLKAEPSALSTDGTSFSVNWLHK
jgi:hypothetical protein